MSETEDLMHAWRVGAIVVQKATHRGSANTKASEEAKVRADASDLGTKEAQGLHEGEKKLLFLRPHGQAY